MDESEQAAGSHSGDDEDIAPEFIDETSEPDEASPLARLRWLRHVLPPAFLLLVLLLALREIQTFDIRHLRAIVRGVAIPNLLLIQLLAFVGVFSMSLYDWRAARTFGVRIAPQTLIRNAWVANAFSNFVGFSGLAGTGIRMLLLGRAGIDARHAAAFSALIVASVPVGLSVMCAVLLLMGRGGGDLLPIPQWLLLAGFAAYLPGYFLVLGKGSLTGLLRALSPQPMSSLVVLAAISVVDWLLAAAVAWFAVQVSGAAVSWPDFLVGYVVASALGILSLIPGGLGVFDTALVVLLAPVATGMEQVVSGLLLYRLCYYLVPWLIAVYVGADKLVLPEYWQHLALVRQWRESRLPVLLRPPFEALTSLGVRVLAYLTFAGGVVLLASSAFPTLLDRLEVLDRFVPMAAIETSHLLSVAIGVLLIALARGIEEQVRGAYVATQLLLVCGALLSLLKGIDYEEATVLIGVALLLRQQRKRFYRRSYPLLSPRSLIWLGVLVVAVVAFAWLGDWVHGNIPLEWERLSRFAPTLEAPRFARGLLIAAWVATMVIGASIVQSYRALPEKPGPEALAEARAILDAHGGSEFAHLVNLGDKSLLWSPDHRAFIQYAQIRDRLIALGDPCGDPGSFASAIVAFRDHADRDDLTPCFYEVHEEGVHRYHDAGFALFKLGETALVSLEDFTMSGKRGESLRYGVNRATRDGARFELLTHPLDKSVWGELREISDSWLRARGAAEKGFSLGYFDEKYLGLAPIAAVRVEQRIVAFASLMPDYARRSTLSIDLMRHLPDAPNGTMDLMFVELIQHARKEGYAYFNLGMAPLGGVGESRYSRVGEKVARLAYEYGNRFYNYKGLRNFKEKFHPQWHSAYFAYPVLSPLPILLMDSAALIAGGYLRIFFAPREN